MFLSVVKSIFDIDNVGKRWGVRILYLLTVILNAGIHFNPYADTDFTPLQSWFMSVYGMTEYDQSAYDALMTGIPLSRGNIIYLISSVIAVIILLASAYIYAGLFVRAFRKEKIASIKDPDPEVVNYAVSHIPDQPIKISKLIGRVLLLMLATVLVALPLMTVTMYFMFLALIGLPFIFTIPVAYLSGDKGLFSSIPYAVKLSRKYYFVNMRSIAVVLFAAIIIDFAVPLVANFSLTAYYILDAALTTWLWLSFARLAGLAYCTMKDFPIKDGKRPFAI